MKESNINFLTKILKEVGISSRQQEEKSSKRKAVIESK